ncbi:hypothetical protein PI124_g10150 [Phytophthora idaei]|nr:hypothetical protein PI125_g7764 [Phytophthora idaei]KAG3155102.1 hypothetical protein PI126_g9313 [Phytophthora idaei]KAG3245104.1 hypothetical protein PI124_g10150 [Phytophthora idaei]
MSSSITRDAGALPSTNAQSSAATVTSTSTTTTTANANVNSSSSPSSSGDGNGRAGNAQQSSSSDGNSPMRRLPAVLRAPPGATANVSSAMTPTAATRSQTQVQAATQQHQRQSQSPLAVSTAAAGNRDITGMGRRHMYPSQALASPYGGGASSPAQMPPRYFGVEGGRIATGSSSYNHDRLSPVSSPAMGESWAGAGNMASRGLKRHLPQQYDGYGRAGSNTGSIRMPAQQPSLQNAASATPSTVRRGPSSNIRSSTMQQMYGMPPSEDPRQYEPSGEARQPRDSTRYETWTSKQLRKKCSHLKLRGLKNVKKHVMVEALYRYYRNQRLKDMADAVSAEKSGAASQQQQIPSPQQPQQRRMETRRPSSNHGSSVSGGRSDVQYQSRYDQRSAGPQSQYSAYTSRSRSYGNYGSQSPSPPSSGGDSGPPPQRAGPKSNSSGYYLDEESKGESQYKEVPVTSEDVIRLVDVVLSPEFVDRLAAELSRWQFWVDVREMYIALLSRQHPSSSAGTSGEGGPVGSGGSATNSRNFKWSSMQLWEIWKELSFAYTKTCFEFTTAGMNERVDDREYINFCDGRPDVYYLHQRLHLRPDLLHLIKSNEYIDEKCTSDASESIAHEQQQAQQQQQAGPLVGSGSPLLRAHKRYKAMSGPGSSSAAYNSARAVAAFRDGTAGVNGSGAAGGGNTGRNGSGQGSGDSRGHSPEENCTENSETTGEEGSSNTANSNASNSSQDVSMRAALAEQKYFGLLLQNFEVIFESLHNKKVLLAMLRKDSKAPDHLIADLHDDIHVLSALKKEFRNKLRHTIQ